MALKIELHWQQTANYTEEIELKPGEIVAMEVAGVDYMDPEAVFNWLNDQDELVKYEPVSYSSAEYDQGSSRFTAVGIVEG